MIAKPMSANSASKMKGFVRSAQSSVGTAVENNQHAAHCGSARFFLVLLRAFFANELADLQFAEAADQRGAEDQREEHRREACIHGTNRDVTKNIQRADVLAQDLIEEVVKHLSS